MDLTVTLDSAPAVVFVSVFELLLNLARNYIFIHTTSKIDAKLGAKLFKHLFRLYYTYFENPIKMIDGIIKQLREYDDASLRSSVEKDDEAMLKVVMKYFHCG